MIGVELDASRLLIQWLVIIAATDSPLMAPAMAVISILSLGFIATRLIEPPRVFASGQKNKEFIFCAPFTFSEVFMPSKTHPSKLSDSQW